MPVFIGYNSIEEVNLQFRTIIERGNFVFLWLSKRNLTCGKKRINNKTYVVTLCDSCLRQPNM